MAPREGDEAPKQRRERPPPKKKKKLVSVKNQLRSVERLLSKADDAKMRGALEHRRLALLKTQEDAARGDKERKLAVRYHKVKFFERKKIMKAQAKLQAEVEAQGWANAEQRAQLKQLDEDEEYVMNFPKTEKYVSLFSRGGDEAHAQAERARLRVVIKANVAAAALLADEDEGGVDAEEAALPDDPELEEDEFFAGAGAGGAAAGHRFFGGDDEGDDAEAEQPRWRTNDLFVGAGGEEEEGDEGRQPARGARQSTGTPRGGKGGAARDASRSPYAGARKGGAAGWDAAAGQGKRKFSGDGAREGSAPAGKRPRPGAAQHPQQQERPARKASWADAGPQRQSSWGGAQKSSSPHGARPGVPPHKVPLRIPASAAAPKSAVAPSRPAPAPAPKAEAKQPLRSRAEGGRKRRPKTK